MSTTTYYHGGPRGIQRGAFLLPPSITKARNLSQYGAAGVHRTDRVYVTTARAAALLYAAGIPGGVIYLCDPVGLIEPDPDCTQPGLSWQCEKARVLRVIKPSAAEIAVAREALLEKIA